MGRFADDEIRKTLRHPVGRAGAGQRSGRRFRGFVFLGLQGRCRAERGPRGPTEGREGERLRPLAGGGWPLAGKSRGVLAQEAAR